MPQHRNLIKEMEIEQAELVLNMFRIMRRSLTQPGMTDLARINNTRALIETVIRDMEMKLDAAGHRIPHDSSAQRRRPGHPTGD